MEGKDRKQERKKFTVKDVVKRGISLRCKGKDVYIYWGGYIIAVCELGELSSFLERYLCVQDVKEQDEEDEYELWLKEYMDELQMGLSCW